MKKEEIEIIIDISRTEMISTLKKIGAENSKLSDVLEVYLDEAKEALLSDYTGFITALIHDDWQRTTLDILKQSLETNK